MSAKRTRFSRRQFIAAAPLPLLYACTAVSPRTNPVVPGNVKSLHELAKLEQLSGGRAGIASLNLATGETLGHRDNERFAMCSTFKWLLGAALLRRVDQGQDALNRSASWTADDLVFWSPVTKPLVEANNTGVAHMSLGDLCAATLRTSDNTAANVLLRELGGPAGLTHTLRAFGDNVTRLDRWEPELNANTPGDPRDTSTPASMLWLMQHVLYGPALSSASRHTLKRWLIANETGDTRLRAGLPEGWIIGDRTGTSTNNANNNLAFAEDPDPSRSRGPLLIVSFLDAPNPTKPAANQHHAQVAKTVFGALIQ